MNKQAEHYENVGDSLKGNEAEAAYRAAQNHLQPSDTNYMQDVNRLQEKIINTVTWGGPREGAGRPATGRKRQNFYITDDENSKLREYLEQLRNPTEHNLPNECQKCIAGENSEDDWMCPFTKRIKDCPKYPQNPTK